MFDKAYENNFSPGYRYKLTPSLSASELKPSLIVIGKARTLEFNKMVLITV
jgi:hypothetical protein